MEERSSMISHFYTKRFCGSEVEIEFFKDNWDSEEVDREGIWALLLKLRE